MNILHTYVLETSRSLSRALRVPQTCITELYGGTLIENYITKSYYGFGFRKYVTELYEGLLLRNCIAESIHDIILRIDLMKFYYGIMLRNHITE